MKGKALDQFTEKWLGYMRARRGDYAFRSRTRYAAVADALFAFGLNDSHLVMDIGAGSCQFIHYLSRERGWTGRYHPIDAVIGGEDIEMWLPRIPADYIVCIEVLEHLKDPEHMLQVMNSYARFVAVATTPNPAKVDVLSCDPTHVSSISAQTFTKHGWHTWRRSFFGVPGDTLLACNKLPDYATICNLGRDHEVADQTRTNVIACSGKNVLGSGLSDAAGDGQSRAESVGNVGADPNEFSRQSSYSPSAEGEPEDITGDVQRRGISVVRLGDWKQWLPVSA